MTQHVPFDGIRARIFRVYGPPGTGKTHWLVEQAERAAEKFGVDNVKVVSMTRTASREFALRNSAIPTESVTTLHALCYRGIGKPAVLSNKYVEEWNKLNPGYAVTAFDGEFDGSANLMGDILLRDLNVARARMEEPGYEVLADFAAAFREWKDSIDRIDFTDMLERALLELEFAPGMPAALFVDEAQDLSTLELVLIEKWAMRCEVVVLVGDSDQVLYEWRGADRRVLVKDGEAPFRVLSQSYRVPRAVHRIAMGAIHGSSTWSGAQYLPKDQDGEVSRIDFGFERPAQIVDDLEAFSLSNPLTKDAMLISTAGYMLNPVISEMRRRGIGYHNPYRGEWNPLMTNQRDRVTGADRVLACARLKTPRDWRIALSGLRGEHSGGPIRAGKKTLIENLDDSASPSRLAHTLAQVLLPGGWELVDHSGTKNPSKQAVAAMVAASTKAVAESMEFPLTVFNRDGISGVESPRVVVGTIHSCKGGEAEHVYLNCALSRAARKQQEIPGWSGYDSIQRTMYVGITRASHRLVICGSGRNDGVCV